MKRFLYTLPAALIFLTITFCQAALSQERFTDNNDGTITDHQLDLMWANTDNGGDVDWKQSERWIRFTFPTSLPVSYENWRLPTIEELRSLYVADEKYKGYEAECGQHLKIVSEITITCGLVWSSDRWNSSVDTAQVFNFKRGIFYSDYLKRKRGYRALAVRDLQN